MNDKSHVSLERHVCLVCGVAYDTGSILLDKRLRQSLERYTTTGWGLCAEHQKLAHLKREAFAAMFNVQLAADQVCVFVEPGIIEKIQTMVSPASS